MNGHRLPLLGLALLILLSACDEDITTTDPAPPDLVTFRLDAPESVYSGEAFELTVTALTDHDSGPAVGFSGTVGLAVSEGSVSPATVTLSAGLATVPVTLSGHAGPATLTASLGSVNGTAAVTVIGSDPVARIEIAPAAFLLRQSGESQQLEARAFDALGRPTRADIQWRSSDGSYVTVDSAGLAIAVADLGSAQIVAEASDVQSPPALALVARPVDGAVLVADSQITTDGAASAFSPGGSTWAGAQRSGLDLLEPVDPDAEYGLGWQYRVRISTPQAPEIGAILLGTGGAPVGGRVVAVTAIDDGWEVILELVPLDEMFQAFTLAEVVSLDDAEIVWTEEVAEAYQIQTLPDGALRFEPRAGSTVSISPGGDGGDLMGDFTAGPLKCSTTLGGTPLQLRGTPAITLRPALAKVDTFDIATGLSRTGVKGELGVELKFDPRLSVRLEGSIDCQVEVAMITVPIGGPAALFFGLQVPLGAGFALGGTTTFAEFGATYTLTGAGSIEAGLACDGSGTCSSYGTPAGTFASDVKPDFPALEEDFKVEVKVDAYAFAKGNLGPRIRSLQLEMMELRAGGAKVLDLSPVSVQAETDSYGSSFRTAFTGVVKAGSHVEKIASLFKAAAVKLEFGAEVVLAESPAGRFTIEPATVRAGNATEPGDLATFKVEFTRTTYFGTNAVDGVEFYRKTESGDLEPFTAPACEATPDSSVFTCTTFLPESLEGEQTFFAFVQANVFGVPLPVPLKVAADGTARAVLDVTTGSGIDITVEPDAVSLPEGGSRQFTATVTGTPDTAVTWHAMKGNISVTGLYTQAANNDTITVTSVADPSVKAYAVVSAPPTCADVKPVDECGSGSSWGDPHLITIDGQHYDFMAVGDFVLLESTDPADDFEIQTRYRRPDVREEFSWNQAVAMRVGRDTVNIYSADQGRIELMINNEDVPTDEGLSRILPGGGTVLVRNDTVFVTWPDRTLLQVTPAWWEDEVLAAVEVFLPRSRAGSVQGLLGDFDGDPSNDIRIRDGEVLVDPRTDELYLEYRQSWRVPPGTPASLFFRADENWDAFYPPNVVDFGDLGTAAVAQAEAVCRAAGVKNVRVLRSCIFDVALTGDEEWALVATGVDPDVPGVTVVPGLTFMGKGGERSFYAIVTGTEDPQLVWSASAGSVTVNDATEATYTAPDAGGEYTLTAALASDPSVRGAAALHVLDFDVPPGFNAIWTGAVDSLWYTPENWLAGALPGLLDNVFIPAGAVRQPVLTQTAAFEPWLYEIYHLLVEEGATLTFEQAPSRSAIELHVGGDVDARGEITGEGLLVLTGPGRTLRGTIDDVAFRSGATILSGATTVTGQLSLQGGSLDLSGQTLTVEGEAHVGRGYLYMNNALDRLLLRGNARFSGPSTPGTLTAGEIRMAGDLEVVHPSWTNYPGAFMPTGTRVVLDGTSEQTLTFVSRPLNGLNASHFHDLEITNPTAITIQPMYANHIGVPVRGDLRITSGATIQGAGGIQVGGDLYTSPTSSIAVGRVQLAGELGTTAIEGAFTPGLLQLNSGNAEYYQPLDPGITYGAVQIASRTRLIGPTTAGSVSVMWDNGRVGDLDFGGQQLTVAGDFTTVNGGVITMTDPADLLIVDGSASLGSGAAGKLTAGEVRVAGDLSAVNGFKSTGTRMVLDGDTAQIVTFTSPSFTGSEGSWFHDLEITNTTGVELRLQANRLSVNGYLDLKGSMYAPGNMNMFIAGTLFLRAASVLTNEGTINVAVCQKEAGHTINGTDPCPAP